MRRIAVLDAPSNLGLRPPTPTSVPGCAKAPGALRDHGLVRRLNARDAGCLTPPRYDPGDWRPGDGVCHAAEISAYSRKLADRIGAILDQGEFPVIVGGDCSIVLGSALAMHRLGEAVGGRIGLVFVDGHSDFRHPGNASYVGAAAGEDLALVTGRGQTDLAAMEGRRPYYRDIDVVVMGIRAQDEYRLDLQAAGIVTRPVPTLRVEGAARSAQWARDQLVDCAGYWVHIDVDVLDPAVMPAVDAPEPGGIAFPELEILLAGLVESPHCLGVEITVFDPDYDPDGRYAEEITSAIVAGLKPAQLVDARPDLAAARRDFAGPGKLGPGLPGQLGPGRLGPGQLGPGQLGPGQLGPGHLGPGRTGFGVPATPAAWPGGEADPVTAGPAAAGDDVWTAAAMSGGGPVSAADETEFRALSRRTEFDAGAVDGQVEFEAYPPGTESDTAPGLDQEPVEDGAGPPEPAAADDDAPADRDVESPPAPDAAPADSCATASDASADLPSAEPPSADLADADLAEADREAEGAAPDRDDAGWTAGDGSEPVHELAPTDEPAAERVDDDQRRDGDALEAGVPGPVDGPVGDPVAERGAEPMDDAVDDDPEWAGAGGPRRIDAVEASPWAGAGGPAPHGDAEVDQSRAPMRPLGSAPMLDSQPLPATMPGMLRPRSIDDFTLPAQRPAFEVGPEQPVDLT